MDDRRGKGRGAKDGKKGGFKRSSSSSAASSASSATRKFEYIDYKDVRLLQGFIPERGKILPRRISGTCSMHQRGLMHAIKRARNIALLPFTAD